MRKVECPVCGAKLQGENYRTYTGPVGVEEQYIRCNINRHYYYEFAYGSYIYQIGDAEIKGTYHDSIEVNELKGEIVRQMIEVQKMQEEKTKG